MHALVIDDSRAMRMILRRILTGLGHEVTDVPDGETALETLREGADCDVALVDWNMAGMTGLDLVTALRAEPAWGDLRIVMVTTETEMDRMVTALEAGADEYVMKPFTPDVIQAKLELLGLTSPAGR